MEKKNKFYIIYIFVISKIIFVLLLLFLMNHNIYSPLKNLKDNIKENKNFDEIEYIQICKEGKLLFPENFNGKSEFPQVSTLIPVYNKQQYILTCLRSIQNQSLRKLEILFIDDKSKDNSSKIIELSQKNDLRIKIIKHEHNKGLLASRKTGVFLAKGEFLTVLDPDDLLLNPILNDSYFAAKERGVEIVEFNRLENHGKEIYKRNHTHSKEIIYQPDLQKYFIFYTDGKLEQNHYCIWSYLIKKELFIRSIHYIGNFYFEQNINFIEDQILLFSLIRFCNSLLYLNKYGYFYFINPESICTNILDENKVDNTFHDLFFYLKYIFEFTSNEINDKKLAFYAFKINFQYYHDGISKLKKNFDFYFEILKLYLNYEKIIDEDKKIIENYLDQFKIAESKALKLI